jgi:hypothetical protein
LLCVSFSEMSLVLFRVSNFTFSEAQVCDSFHFNVFRDISGFLFGAQRYLWDLALRLQLTLVTGPDQQLVVFACTRGRASLVAFAAP